MITRRWWVLSAAVAGAILLMFLLGTETGGAVTETIRARLRGGYTVAERLDMHGADVRERSAALFARAGLAYPPRKLAMVAFKDVRQLELYGRDDEAHPWRRVAVYPILGMSGRLGPKLREGDFQVPEGVYGVEFLNANSQFHVSLRLDYPNSFDRARAAQDGRKRPGSDIMIHGSTASIGCLAMGNQVAEDLFIFAAEAGKENVFVLIAPTDFRKPGARAEVRGPHWLADLYQLLRRELQAFPS